MGPRNIIVNTEAASPYLVLLQRLIASSSFLKGIIVATGPNTSS